MARSSVFIRLASAFAFAVVVLSGALGLPSVPAVLGASITVTTKTDELDVNGKCSLREAVIAANTDTQVDSCAAGNGADSIRLGSGTYTLSLEGILEDDARTGDLDITGPLSIVGAGRDATTIVSDATDRVLDVHGVHLTVRDASIVGQASMLDPNPNLPPYITHGRGGAIRNQAGELTVRDSSVTGIDVARDACRFCWDGEGGGIANEGGTLVITGSSVSGSAAWGGAVASIGGKVVVNASEFTGEAIEYGGTWMLYGTHASMSGVNITGSRGLGPALITGGPDGTLTMTNSELRDNWGAISNVNPGRLTMSDTVIADNLGVQDGPLGDVGPGALSNSGEAELTRVSMLNNAGGLGGAIRNFGSLTIRDSTIAGNSGLPGAIDSSFEGSSLTMVNTTVSGNKAKTDETAGAIAMWNGMILSSTIVDNQGANEAVWLRAAQIANTVIADNVATAVPTSPDCGSGIFDVPGSFTSLGYNLLENGTGCIADGAADTDILGVDPGLGPLQDNGGTTLSHMPLPGSALIDAGSPTKSPHAASACPSRDQLGVKRPQDGDGDGTARCDIGAVERPAAGR